MSKNTIDGYIKWITPTPGDPTYSLLKAHLLFEELLRTYLKRLLPNAEALDGARLSFAQVLSLAKACSPKSLSEHWSWKAIGDLNRLRNMLAHQTAPKNLRERLDEFTGFVADNTVPLPAPFTASEKAVYTQDGGHFFTKADMAIVGLYAVTADVLGFNIDTWFLHEEEQSAAMAKAVSSDDS